MADAPSPSRLRMTNLPIRPLLEEEPRSRGSPRTTVAGHLQGLDLDLQNEIPQLDFSESNDVRAGSSKISFGSTAFNPHIFLPNQTYNAPATPPSSSHGPVLDLPTAPKASGTHSPLEIPETPRLRPVSSPSPLLSAAKLKPSRSPPPTSSVQALWWSDTEITGHDPKDPNDDGYGINGVGFLPTAAIANARAERRKKQVAEWKNREAREARQKRSDRRRRRDAEVGAPEFPSFHNDDSSRTGEGRRVRFLEI